MITAPATRDTTSAISGIVAVGVSSSTALMCEGSRHTRAPTISGGFPDLLGAAISGHCHSEGGPSTAFTTPCSTQPFTAFATKGLKAKGIGYCRRAFGTAFPVGIVKRADGCRRTA